MNSPHQPAGPLPGFLHFAVGSSPQGLQELVAVLQVVFVVVPLHRLLPAGHLRRSFPERSAHVGWSCSGSRPTARREQRDVHAAAFVLVTFSRLSLDRCRLLGGKHARVWALAPPESAAHRPLLWQRVSFFLSEDCKNRRLRTGGRFGQLSAAFRYPASGRRPERSTARRRTR